MLPVSLVVITKNEAHIIERLLKALQPVVSEILVADTGSSDTTVALAQESGARVISLPWRGFGWCKQQAAMAAANNWILALDADEIPDATLVDALSQINYSQVHVVYRMRFKSFIGNQEMKYGDWKPFFKLRLFNRLHHNWDDAAVHEKIVTTPDTLIKTLPGNIHHHSSRHVKEYAEKMNAYAFTMAEKYFHAGKRPSTFKLYFYYPVIFFKAYVLQGGFLDGRTGYLCARIVAQYAMLKYHYLQELRSGSL